MSRAVVSLARPGYGGISLYAPDRAPCALDLSDNTNRWGTAPAVARALQAAADAGAVTRYPDAYAAPLKQALARYTGMDASMVVTGCGSDDVLDSAIRAFAAPGELLACPDPTFAMVPTFARMNGLDVRLIPLTESLDANADALLETGARIIYLCSPNNPTGASLRRETIERIVAGAPGLVIIDEAYAEFAGCNCLDLAASSDRVLVTRTMSKAFGLAGLRAGYAVGAPALVAEVEKSRGPYKVGVVAERAAVAALDEGLTWARERALEAIENRERLADALRARGLRPLPSAANFVLVPVPEAAKRAGMLRARGVAVRPFAGLPRVVGGLRATGGDALRITVGPWPMLEALLGALDDSARGTDA